MTSMTQYAISDIHGCSRTFMAMLDQLAFTKADELYLLGDYVNRGPDSKGVIDIIWRLQEEGYQVDCLMGNHESMTFRNFDTETRTGLPQPSGPLLVESFGVQQLSQIPEPYIYWMRTLPYYREIPGYILVHAGLNFGFGDPFFSKESLIWIRDWHNQIRHDWLGDRVIIHGHTPAMRFHIEWMCGHLDRQQVLDIDCGCVITSTAGDGFGQLCAFDLSNRRLFFQKNVEPHRH